MWGCTVIWEKTELGDKIVPTHVGVYRLDEVNEFIRYYCPHACGGVPRTYESKSNIIQLSPRMWGCTGRYYLPYRSLFVVPTHVGVYRAIIK